MLTVVAKLQAAAGKEDQLRSALETMVAAVKESEKGQTVAYSVHVSADDPATFMFYELYASPESAETHRNSQHMAALNTAIRDGQLLAGRPVIERYTRLAGVD